MGQLIDGEWRDRQRAAGETGGRFERRPSTYRNWVTADGSPGPSGEGGFAAESGRYHLYVSYACPWAHRTLIFRKLKGLEAHIGLSVVHPLMLEDGWTFETGFDGATGDRLLGKRFLREIYLADDPGATTKVTVPVLWDKERQAVVSNESADIIRMLNGAFDGITGNRLDFYPEALRAEIDEINNAVYRNVNNGVYKAGFATTQAAYDEAVGALFDELDRLDARLSRQRYLLGDRITEADWRLFTTLARFDPVYVGHFKCNVRRLVDYPALWPYARDLYQVPGVAETVRFDHIRVHYHASHRSVNPHGIVPKGPLIDFSAPHGRERLKAA